MDEYSTLPFIYDAAISQTNWVEALDRAGDAVSAKGVLLLAVNKSGLHYSVNTANSLYVGRGGDLEDYSCRFRHYEEEGLGYLLSAPPFAPVRDTDMWPDLEALRRREDIAFTRNLLGIERRVSFNLSHNRGLNAGIIYQFDQSIREVSRGSIEKAAVLAPHIAKTIEINRFYFQLYDRYRAVLSMLDRVSVGICVVSPTGSMVIINEEARRIFDQRDGISISRDNRLICADHDLQRQIGHCLRLSCDTARGEADKAESVLSVTRRSGGEAFVVEISPLRDSESEIESGFSGALVTIIDPENAPKLSAVPLKKLYGLSEAEREVAELLARGLANKAISEMRNVSEETVKNQTKSIYAKVGVSSRSQVIRKMVFLEPPIS